MPFQSTFDLSEGVKLSVGGTTHARESATREELEDAGKLYFEMQMPESMTTKPSREKSGDKVILKLSNADRRKPMNHDLVELTADSSLEERDYKIYGSHRKTRSHWGQSTKKDLKMTEKKNRHSNSSLYDLKLELENKIRQVIMDAKNTSKIIRDSKEALLK